MTIKRVLIPISMVAATWMGVKTSSADGTHGCTSVGCCSPHGANSSKSGSVFAGCHYDSGTKLYTRDYTCSNQTACFAAVPCTYGYHPYASGMSSNENATDHNLQFTTYCNEGGGDD